MILPTSYHIGLSDAHGAKFALLPGDPGRVAEIASYLDGAKEIAKSREYTTYLGTLAGEPILVTSTGIGGPSAAIAMEELAALGVKNFIRIGTCGGMQTDVMSGDLVIATGAIRMEGTSKEYLPIEFPAVADFEIAGALREAAKELGFPAHVGVVECKDSFYGQHSPDSMPVAYELKNKWSAWIAGGALASEMESAALFTIASVRRLRVGSVFTCVWNQERVNLGFPCEETHDNTRAIKCATLAAEKLIRLWK